MKNFIYTLFTTIGYLIRLQLLTLMFNLDGFCHIVFEKRKLISYKLVMEYSDSEVETLTYIEKLNNRCYGDESEDIMDDEGE